MHENVAFHKVNEIGLTRSKWLSTFIIDLKPYENFLNKLSEELGNVGIAAHSSVQFYDYPSKQDYRQIIKGSKGEIVALLNDQHTLVENYTELHAIHTKIKRAVIPIIVKVLTNYFELLQNLIWTLYAQMLVD